MNLHTMLRSAGRLSIAALLIAFVITACTSDEAPSEEELVRPGAFEACRNFDNAFPEGASGRLGENASADIDNAHYGANEISKHDGAYIELRDRLRRAADALRGGDEASARSEAVELAKVCGPISRGEYPEPQPATGG